ncbi:tyrosine-type recombinase/integrase [Rhodococcus zopfii]|uniref:tyrosine-type recombinase/integrase n=1 Tax=Rhodococcus zopfii TaxID=43772 RepID=UPI00364D9D32
MTTDNPAPRRTRRAEPITKRTAKNGTASYEFRADLGLKPDGSRDRRRFTYPTLREARAEYRRITTEVAAGVHVARAKVTVGEHIEAWLRGRRDVRPVTLEGYRYALKPAVDRLGGLPLQQLTKAHVDDLVTWRLTEGRTTGPVLTEAGSAILDYVTRHPEGVTYSAVVEAHGTTAGKHLDRLRAAGHVTRPKRGLYVAAQSTSQPPQRRRGVSARTVTTMLVQLSAALDDAVEQGLLTRNVARLVDRPQVDPVEMKVWTVDQAETFRRHVRDHRLYACWLLTVQGLRRSEVMGLTWSAIDFEAGTVSIDQGRVAIGSRSEIGAPKSRRSRRTLQVPSGVLASLRTLRATQARERLALGSGYPETDLVAVHEDGSEIRPEWYSDEFARLAASAGVPVIRLHDVRHTAATRLHDEGLSVLVISAWLGHDPATDLRVYGHVYDDALKSAGATLFGDADGTDG